MYFILLLKKLKYVVGFSDHTIGENSSSVAVTLGANIIEKHITLDTKLPGPDHACSLPCKDLKKFVDNLVRLLISYPKHHGYIICLKSFLKLIKPLLQHL